MPPRDIHTAEYEGPDRRDHHADPAPWWVKEIRVYGISGMFAAAACWFGFTVYQNSRADAKDANVAVQRLADSGQVIVSKNTEAFYTLNSSVQQNVAAVQQLTQAVRDNSRDNNERRDHP